MQNNKKELPAEDKIKSDALRLLGARPRSVEELRGRLRQKRHSKESIEEVLELLKKQGLLDDAKFAKLFAESSIHARPVGKRRLAMEMKKKGLSAGAIEGAMADFKDYDEKAAAKEAVANRFRRTTGMTPQKKKARFFGFLKRRGFSNDAIFAALSELFKEDVITEGMEFDES